MDCGRTIRSHPTTVFALCFTRSAKGIRSMNTEATPSKGGSFSVRNVLIALALPVLLILGIAGYYYYTAEPENTGRIDYQIGLADREDARTLGDRTKLADAFVDANADLLADVPSDPMKLVSPEKLIFSGIGGPDAIARQDSFKPLIEHLSKVIGKPVEFEAIGDARQQVEKLRDGKLHISLFNTGQVPTAVNLAGFIPYCAASNAEGNYRHEMVLIAPAGTSIDSPAKIKGQRLAVTTITSNSGYKMPIVVLRDQFQLLAGKDYDIVISGSHDLTMEGIKKKLYPVGAVASDLLDRALNDEKLAKSDYIEVYRSKESLPSASWGYAYNLDPKLADKVREAFDTFVPAGKAGKFVKVDYKTDWETVRKIDLEILNWSKTK